MNTNRHFNPGGPTHLTGRKYVCGPCAEELGKSVGMVPEADAEQLRQERDDAKAITRIAEKRLLVKEDLVAAIRAAMDLDPPLYGLTVEKTEKTEPKPKPPAKKPAAKKTEE